MFDQRYVSRELTHFVGAKLYPDREKQIDLLVKIVKGGVLGERATPKGTPQPMNYVYGQPFVPHKGEFGGFPGVCFCDIPGADLPIHVKKYGEFGIAFPKTFLVKQGASPVFYFAEDSGFAVGTSEVKLDALYQRMLDGLFGLFDSLRDRRDLDGLRALVLQRLVAYLKPFDSSLPDDHIENYYMEREWRVLGKVEFEPADISRIIIPHEFGRRLRESLPEYCGQISFPEAS